MIETVAQKALANWGLEDAKIALVAQRENVVFRVTHNASNYALRLHRPGYQTPAMVTSELTWMRYLKGAGLHVPEPLPTKNGALLVDTGGYHADLLTWLAGTPVGATGLPLDLPDRAGTFFKIGQLMARMHQLSDQWTPPENFDRQHWDIDGLLGDAPLWGPFWENPGLDPNACARLLDVREKLRDDLTQARLDYGLIHADMLRENVMIDGATLGLIDFDDSGFGFRLFDVVTALFKNRSEPDYATLEARFLQGYRTVRPIDTTLMAQFTVIRALTYLGWIIPRINEPGAETRQARFLASALPLVDDYLNA